MPNMLYFASLLLTGALTGFLAWHAWRHRSVPGTRAYAGLALGECLLSLAEILSLLSSTPAQALFWFRARYLTLAVIPVFWLVFAMEYSGRKAWLSKRLLAGLFVVPAITQALQWSNSLHGLWVRQEAGFYQIGAFWIADTSARLPGPGFLAHTFYGMTFLLIGIVLLLVAAWRMRRRDRLQAVLVAGAATIALLMAFLTSLNLMPRAEFNPFTPGIGLSVLLIAVTVFRFQFLKRARAAEAGPKAQAQRSLALFLLFFVALAVGIVAVGYASYQDYEHQLRAQVESQLSGIAALKVAELQDWRRERLADAEILHQNPVITNLAQRILENPDDAPARAELQAWLDRYQVYRQYDRVFLLDVQGIERISSPATPKPVAEHLAQQIPTFLGAGQVTFVDFHRHFADDSIHLSLVVPIYAEPDHRPLGVLVLSIDPSVYLYPFIQQWPVPSASAETLLVRRDGTDVLFLNELRFYPGAALNLRSPLENTQMPAVKATLGRVGIVEGIDYRGQPVIADVRRVPDSPWFLVTRLDTAEVYEPLWERLWLTMVLLGALLAAAGATLGLVWQQQRARADRAQVKAAESLSQSERKFREIVANLDEGYYSVTPEGVLLDHNQAFSRILGFPADHDLRGANMPDFWDNPADRQGYARAMADTGSISNYQITVKTQKGEKRTVLVSAHMAHDQDHHPLQIEGVSLDITERKKAEEEILLNQARLKSLVEVLQHSAPNTQQFLDFALEQAIELTGSKLGYIYFYNEDIRQFVLNTWSKEVLPVCSITDPQTCYELDKTGVWGEAVCQRQPIVLNDFEAAHPLKKGFPEGHAPLHKLMTVPVFDQERIVAVVGVANKQSDYHEIDVLQLTLLMDAVWKVLNRRQAEESLRASEVRYRRLFESAKDGILIIDAESGSILDANPFLCELLGFLKEQLLGKEIWEIGTFKDIAANQASFMELQQKGYVRYDDMPLATADGRRVQVEFVSNVYRANNQTVIQCNIRDITEHKRQDAEIVAAHAELQHLLLESEQSRRALLSVVEDQKEADEVIRTLNAELETRVRNRTAQLEAANQELEAFAYSVSHDLRAPLRAMDGFSAALISQYQGQLDEQGRHYLDRIQAASQRMGNLINDLLDLSRVTRREMTRQRVDLAVLAREVAAELHALDPRRQVEFDIAGSLEMEGDTHLLRLTLENLMGNAWKFTGSRRPARIEVGVLPEPSTPSTDRDNGEGPVFFVRDNGVGFDMAYADKLFAPFQRLHAMHEFPGTGIGLVTVKRIITRHGGRIWSEAEVDRGATFYFTLGGV